jgi:hypothetical protein
MIVRRLAVEKVGEPTTQDKLHKIEMDTPQSRRAYVQKAIIRQPPLRTQ